MGGNMEIATPPQSKEDVVEHLEQWKAAWKHYIDTASSRPNVNERCFRRGFDAALEKALDVARNGFDDHVFNEDD